MPGSVASGTHCMTCIHIWCHALYKIICDRKESEWVIEWMNEKMNGFPVMAACKNEGFLEFSLLHVCSKWNKKLETVNWIWTPLPRLIAWEHWILGWQWDSPPQSCISQSLVLWHGVLQNILSLFHFVFKLPIWDLWSSEQCQNNCWGILNPWLQIIIFFGPTCDDTCLLNFRNLT